MVEKVTHAEPSLLPFWRLQALLGPHSRSARCVTTAAAVPEFMQKCRRGDKCEAKQSTTTFNFYPGFTLILNSWRHSSCLLELTRERLNVRSTKRPDRWRTKCIVCIINPLAEPPLWIQTQPFAMLHSSSSRWGNGGTDFELSFFLRILFFCSAM